MSASSARKRTPRNRPAAGTSPREPRGPGAGMPPAATAAPEPPVATEPTPEPAPLAAAEAPVGMPPAPLAGPAQPPGPHPALPRGIAPIGRIPVTDVLPSVDGGTR
ncbi:MAG TPA: hypothetical protein PKI09_08970, partial [Dermatophilaceae bacterium]|nr:hypothetical protein [Dermatophilaceae bacterium]HPZ67889.1 hypothetical protein [Dermatophilaceae bacterium]HQD02154.1 hypothetical protein [Dermatophilaceae bacterium]